MAHPEAEWMQTQLERLREGPPFTFDLVEPATVDDLLALTDAGLEFHETEPFPAAGLHRGHDAVRAYIGEFTGPFERFIMEIEELVPGDDGRVVALVTNRVRGQGSGAAVEMRSAWVFTIAGERIVRIEPFVDIAAALAAAGAARS